MVFQRHQGYRQNRNPHAVEHGSVLPPSDLKDGRWGAGPSMFGSTFGDGSGGGGTPDSRSKHLEIQGFDPSRFLF